jgi:hypothetical protein
MRILGTVFICASLWAQDAAITQSADQWEYCRLEPPPDTVATDGKFEIKVQVCFMTEKGCRWESIVTSETAGATERERRLQARSVVDAARAKALGQLGRQGWELVGVVPGEMAPGFTGFYLKRRLPPPK